MNRKKLVLASITLGLLCASIATAQIANASVTFDLNNDGIVDMQDIGQVVAAFGSYPGHQRWNPLTDLDGNGKTNMKDIGMIARHFGERAPHFVVPEFWAGTIIGLAGCFTALAVFGLIKPGKHNFRNFKR